MLFVLLPLTLHGMDQPTSSSSTQSSSLSITTTLESVNRQQVLFLSYAVYRRRNHNDAFILHEAKIQHRQHDNAAQQYLIQTYKPSKWKKLLERHKQQSDIPPSLIENMLAKVDPRDAQCAVFTSLENADETHRTATIHYAIHKQFQKTTNVLSEKTLSFTHDSPTTLEIKGPPPWGWGTIKSDNYKLIITVAFNNEQKKGTS